MHEETFTDHNLGRFMNHNLAEYHVPVNADVHDIEVIFVEEHDDKASPIGVKGLGEIGIVGTRRGDRQCDPPRDRQAHPRPADHHRQSVERLSAVAARDGEHALSAGELDGPDSS